MRNVEVTEALETLKEEFLPYASKLTAFANNVREIADSEIKLFLFGDIDSDTILKDILETEGDVECSGVNFGELAEDIIYGDMNGGKCLVSDTIDRLYQSCNLDSSGINLIGDDMMDVWFIEIDSDLFYSDMEILRYAKSQYELLETDIDGYLEKILYLVLSDHDDNKETIIGDIIDGKIKYDDLFDLHKGLTADFLTIEEIQNNINASTNTKIINNDVIESLKALQSETQYINEHQEELFREYVSKNINDITERAKEL